LTNEHLATLIRILTPGERRVLKYFITYRSVGELLAVRELRGLYGVKEPLKVINRLVELGLLERGIGCYNVSRKVMDYVKRGVLRLED